MSSASPCFSTSQNSGYSLTTTSTSYATCPGATAKRFGSERVSSHSLFESRNRTPQVLLPHSHRKPAVVRPLLIHWALRSLRSRCQASLYAMRFSRPPKDPCDSDPCDLDTATRPSAQAYRAPLAFIATDEPRRFGLILSPNDVLARTGSPGLLQRQANGPWSSTWAGSTAPGNG